MSDTPITDALDTRLADYEWDEGYGELLGHSRELERVTHQLARTLEGVLNSACHPDIARRAVLVPLDPVRDALGSYRKLTAQPSS